MFGCEIRLCSLLVVKVKSKVFRVVKFMKVVIMMLNCGVIVKEGLMNCGIKVMKNLMFLGLSVVMVVVC